VQNFARRPERSTARLPAQGVIAIVFHCGRLLYCNSRQSLTCISRFRLHVLKFPSRTTGERDRAVSRWNVRNNKRRMRKIELEIESCIFVRIDDQRGIKSEIHGSCQAACAAGSAKNLNLTRRNCGAGRGRKTGFGIGGSGQQNVSGIAADGERHGGVSAGGDAGIAQDFAELIQLQQVNGRVRCGINRDRRAAPLRSTCIAHPKMSGRS
jgi:hypothetical protein